MEPIRNEAPAKRNLQGEAKEAIDFLNRKTGRNYRPTKVNLDFVVARLLEGYSLQECKIVVAMKIRDWKGTEWERFLQPSTLFNCLRFNQYAGLIPAGSASDNREFCDDLDLS